jgi:outer membrane immunogenic protein
MKTIVLSAACAQLLVCPVLADDADVTGPFTWTGAHIGVQAGYTWGKSNGGAYVPLAPIPPFTGDIDPEGFIGGVSAGYNHQFENPLVIGIEGDFNFASVEGDSSLFMMGIPSPFDKASGDLEWTASIRARAGYAIDRVLPYVTAGIAFGKYEFTPDYFGIGPLPDSKVHVGPTVGAGIEYAITDQLTTRFEYRYTDFGDATYAIPGFCGCIESRVDLKTHDIKIGLQYKF